MAEDLSYNLKATGEKFIWDGTLDNLKKFVSDELKLLGKWTSPGGETKLFTSGSVSLKWQSKTSKWITVYGSPNEVNDVTEQLKSSCEVATTDPINVDECGVDSLNNGDHAEANIDEPTDDEIATGMLNETNLTIPISSSTECKFIKDKLSNIEAEVKFLEAKFLDKTLNLTNDLNNLKKYCLDNSTEYVNSLRHENASLKDENRALKDSLEISKFALSDLNTKVKELENEKACLTTSLKILYQDFNQSPEHCFNKQEAAASTDNNCSCVKSSLASAESHTSQNNETILIPDDETKPSKKKHKARKSAKEKKTPQNPDTDQSGNVKSPQRASTENGHQSDNSWPHRKKVTAVIGDSIIKNVQGWRLSDSNNYVVVKSFGGANISDMEDYLKHIIRKEPANLILHVGTNDLRL